MLSSISAGRRFLIAALLLTQAGLLAEGAARHSPPSDEVGHLTAGLFHWTTGRFDLYRVNPPLVRLTATILPLWAGAKTPWPTVVNRPGDRMEFIVGRDIILPANSTQVLWLLTLARWSCIPFSLLGGFICYLWARDLYGVYAGLLALTLWCFSPNILGHGQLITPDVGAAACGTLAGYIFWKWLRSPTWWYVVFAGTCLGLAALCKTTWIVLFALFPLLAVIYQLGRAGGRIRWTVYGRQLIVLLAIGLYVVNLLYCFEGSFSSLGDFEFACRTLGIPDGKPSATGNRFRSTFLGSVPVPLPAAYLAGIDEQKLDFEEKMDSYLCGEWRLGGWWYYYAYASMVKVPVGTWVLAALALAAHLVTFHTYSWHDTMVLLAPIAVVFALVSSQTGLNHHFRYVLPVFPFIYIWVGSVAAVGSSRAFVGAIAGLALVWAVASSLSVYPHSLSYFNELAGGPEGGPRHLLNSNIDWGQDLIYLRKWLDAHPDAQPIGLACSGGFDPGLLGIRQTRIPRSTELSKARNGYETDGDTILRPGWYAISLNLLYGRDGGYSYFKALRPVTRAGYSIYIYYLDRNDVKEIIDRLRLD